MSERGEECLVQQLVPEAAVETLRKCVLGWLAWRDVVPVDTRLLRPAQDRHAGQFGAVVGDTGDGAAAAGNDSVELTGHAAPGEGGIGHQAEAFTGEVVDDDQDPEAPAIGQSIAHEVHGPSLVWSL